MAVVPFAPKNINLQYEGLTIFSGYILDYTTKAASKRKKEDTEA